MVGLVPWPANPTSFARKTSLLWATPGTLTVTVAPASCQPPPPPPKGPTSSNFNCRWYPARRLAGLFTTPVIVEEVSPSRPSHRRRRAFRGRGRSPGSPVSKGDLSTTAQPRSPQRSRRVGGDRKKLGMIFGTRSKGTHGPHDGNRTLLCQGRIRYPVNCPPGERHTFIGGDRDRAWCP